MSSSESLKAIHDETRKRLAAGVREEIVVAINHAALMQTVHPEGDRGQIEVAFKIDRKALVVEALRNTADLLEGKR